MNFSSEFNSIRIGHILLVLCCIIYLVWWSITFNPMKSFPALPKYILFLGIAGSGIMGCVFLCIGCSGLTPARSGLSNLVIIAGGIVTYAILLYVTGHFLHRVVTTELFLITAWAVLELCVLSSLYRADAISSQKVLLMILVILLAATISMVCYLAYYKMDPVPAFYDGMVPLILFGAVMAVQIFII